MISCITTLPDGTYLILNGATHGVAGFGLASGPNLNAVLYDPRLRVNSRFSIMASTIVARLYHSEAILMQDGRVMVSGSDPQDGVHPEEYRVEAFYPPYLLSGLEQPDFTITNTEWTYGETVAIGVTLYQGPVSNCSVSLMGAATSTHGNSMGQRTIFPEFECGGTGCTITAPPNVNIAPPGWYQLFVLDGPTPSHSQWVRIGLTPGSWAIDRVSRISMCLGFSGGTWRGDVCLMGLNRAASAVAALDIRSIVPDHPRRLGTGGGRGTSPLQPRGFWGATPLGRAPRQA